MWGMSLTDTIICIVVALAVCGIFAGVCFVIAKKDKTKLEDLLATIPAEKQEALKAENYQPLDGAGIKCATRGLLAAIDTKGETSTVRLIFYNETRDAFYDQTTKIRTSELNGKGYKLFDMIPCQMKYDKEYHIHEFKKIM
ncbi:MAG: hypothetical protein IKO41_03785 [Lachnospiraceae bacterium]|nr:hypothetical protein [Lachnospiraceae bacterium]MBR4605328.1 hypothetical protein [Lachnospiraceae bacterium]MBR6150062.1 hypothetical protein [Lachnospiraceae bacterium]